MKKLFCLLLFAAVRGFAAGSMSSCTGTFTRDGAEYDYSVKPKVKEQKSLSAAEAKENAEAAAEIAGDPWPGSPNPLDPPWSEEDVNWRPASQGYFGPFGSGFRNFDGGVSFHR